MGSLWWVWQLQGICYFLQKRRLNKFFLKFGFEAIEQWLSNSLISQTLVCAPEIREISMHLQTMTAPATTTHLVYTSREITILIWVLILPM